MEPAAHWHVAAPLIGIHKPNSLMFGDTGGDMAEGFLTQHMATHIIAMNLVAPALALLLLRLPKFHLTRAERGLWPALTCQLALLWGWHIPSVFAVAHHSMVLTGLMHTSLFACAIWFWAVVFHTADRSGWQSLSALLITGKLFCLLGVLLTFAPRPLYLPMGGLPEAYPALLADQQLAGLLMLVACPLTYVLAAVIIAARWTGRLEEAPNWLPHRGRR
ncbi:cytochrome c oxidase assembly protein [Nitratireductor basaltis]|uniref:Cytochrome c oxidase assembly protein n=1 Tax=Nitratireductor basaltis TaxID=472175 RepID=A0A084UB00_9HYPH|nr:cytochrome c oxidase assembly protein [Nitratireductor basaltis]KFB10136.1 hypothetical protein EL18_01166 [Nitratireductor basaltis]